jgi:hypothetical protein
MLARNPGGLVTDEDYATYIEAAGNLVESGNSIVRFLAQAVLALAEGYKLED